MCRVRHEQLQEYLDGTLDPLVKIVLAEHLRTCEDCQKELNSLKIIDWDLEHFFLKEIDVPPEVSQVRSRVVEECCRSNQPEEGFALKDVLALQASTFRTTTQFLRLPLRMAGRRWGRR